MRSDDEAPLSTAPFLLSDSVPGVSGGTIAFLLGFYDEFINSLNDLMGRDSKKRKKAFLFLVKLGIGWIIGFGLSVLFLPVCLKLTFIRSALCSLALPCLLYRWL